MPPLSFKKFYIPLQPQKRKKTGVFIIIFTGTFYQLFIHEPIKCNRLPAKALEGTTPLRHAQIALRHHSRHRSGHRRPATGHSIRHRLRRKPDNRPDNSHNRRIHGIGLRRQFRTDRRPYGSIHHHRLQYHSPVRPAGTGYSHIHGRADTRTDGAVQARHSNQVHPLPDCSGFHCRYSPNNLLDPDQRLPRPGTARHTRTVYTQMGIISPFVRQHKLAHTADRAGIAGHHHFDAKSVKETSWSADIDHPRHGSLLPVAHILPRQRVLR